MRDLNTFLEDFLQHAEYDPVKAREYYLRTRKLKGRKAASPVNPRSKVDFNGKPLKPLGKRINEDETPDVSPTGAKLVTYNGDGLGKATYADGSVYDPSVGWKQKRKAASAVNPRSKMGFDGNPLKPLGQRIEEDGSPEVSPTGAKLVDYDGKGLGKATYADGSVYDPSVGWKQKGTAAVATARASVNAKRAKNGLPPAAATPQRRVGAAEQKLSRAKALANKVKDPKVKFSLLKRLSETEKKLKKAAAKYAPETGGNSR